MAAPEVFRVSACDSDAHLHIYERVDRSVHRWIHIAKETYLVQELKE